MRILDRHFRAVLDHAPDGVLVESGDRVAYVNDPYARALGYRSVTELPDSIRDIAHPEDFDRLAWFGRCRATGKPAPTRYAFRARGRNDGVVTFDATVSMTRIEGDVLIMTLVRELPEARARAELVVPGLERLSPRELDVLRLLLRGKRSKEIAALWNVSEKTIGSHRSRAFRKLALRSDLDLFRMAAEMGAL
ncbi:MAG TPA: LuxR C-terminal-related transcriptional regulator [Thermoanaerobaculia bacterium]|nr:LuxR C-terminal-related transcriptional regulator [Thermoanaerobaculia bacterium]